MLFVDRLDQAAEKYRQTKQAFDTSDAELRAAVREARAAGMSVIAIAERIGMNRQTVYRYCED